jgi:hypothetical protein
MNRPVGIDNFRVDGAADRNGTSEVSRELQNTTGSDQNCPTSGDEGSDRVPEMDLDPNLGPQRRPWQGAMPCITDPMGSLAGRA